MAKRKRRAFTREASTVGRRSTIVGGPPGAVSNSGGNIDELPGRGYGWAHQSIAAHLSTLNVEHDASCDPRNGCRWLRMRGVETIGEPFSKRTLLLTRPRATSNPGPGHREPPARSHSPRRRAAGNVPESPRRHKR